MIILCRKAAFACFIAIALAPRYCGATSVLVLRTDEALFVAADSKIVAVNGSEAGLDCKVFISHNYVFSSAGLLKETLGPFDLQKIAEESIATNPNFNSVLTGYENKVLETLPAALRFLLADNPSYYDKILRGKSVVESIFGTVEGDVVRLAYRGFVANAPDQVDTVKNDCPGNCANRLMLAELGEKSAIDEELDRNPQIWKRLGIPNALEQLIERQAVATPQYVSLPTAVVVLLRNGTTKWLRTGVCSAKSENQ